MNKEVKEFLRSNEKCKMFEYKGKKPNAILDYFQWINIFSLLRCGLLLLLRIFPVPPIYRWIYRLCGVKIGKNIFFAIDVMIDPFYPKLISIGDNCILGLGTRIASHEYYLRHLKLGRVSIGNNVIVGAFSTIMCGVTIGDNVVIGAGSLVNKDVPPNKVVGGVPVHEIRELKEIF